MGRCSTPCSPPAFRGDAHSHSQIISKPQAFVIEDASIDPASKVMETSSKNVTHTSIMFVQETQRMTVHPDNPNWCANRNRRVALADPLRVRQDTNYDRGACCFANGMGPQSAPGNARRVALSEKLRQGALALRVAAAASSGSLCRCRRDRVGKLCATRLSASYQSGKRPPRRPSEPSAERASPLGVRSDGRRFFPQDRVHLNVGPVISSLLPHCTRAARFKERLACSH